MYFRTIKFFYCANFYSEFEVLRLGSLKIIAGVVKLSLINTAEEAGQNAKQKTSK